jgi:hypothetical protein
MRDELPNYRKSKVTVNISIYLYSSVDTCSRSHEHIMETVTLSERTRWESSVTEMKQRYHFQFVASVRSLNQYWTGWI